MSANSTILSIGSYNPFRMDTTGKQPQLDTALVVRSGHLSYWLALACGLLLIWAYRSSQTTDDVVVPFYKAGRIKWMTDAEALVRDSYNKVTRASGFEAVGRAPANLIPSTTTESTK
jgi:hypothetical protein